MIKKKQSIQNIAPYPAGKPIDEVKRELGLDRVVKLASNENPFGCSQKAKEAMMKAVEESFLYPDGYSYELRMALSGHHNIAPEQLVFGTGSDGLIELICKAFLKEGDESVLPAPSFSLYESNVRAAGAVPVIVPCDLDFRMNLSAMAEAVTERTRVLWLCNPNNPTGLMYDACAQAKLLARVPDDVLIVLDEAYYEFACQEKDYPDSLKELAKRDNIIILRTFSKVHGLAGLRVGYGMAHPDIIAELERVRAPFNVNLVAQKGAVSALEDKDFVRYTVEENKMNRELLCRGFQKLGLSYLESATNFIAVNIEKDSKKAFEALLKKGYIVKGGHALSMPGYLRVSVGTKEECEGFLTALEEVLSEL
ncbi:MAG: histidinol-phosphate transaminase [Clostridia bacterium]|nr:histidinol-phosphate transaminase [Clostridia bacterium]